MNQLARMINEMEYDDLKLLQKDLDSGNIERLIKERLLYFEKGRKICPVCYRTIGENDEHFTLVFGPHNFKKKAHFCGLDCLGFFISKIKEIREK